MWHRRPGKAAAGVAGLLLILLLTACSQKALLDKIAPADDRQLSARVIADLQGGPGGDSDLAALVNPQIRDKLGPELPKMRAAMPTGTGRLVDASVREFDSFNGHRTRQSFLAYEVDGAKNARALVRIWITRENGAPRVDSLYINTLNAPVEQLTSFSLSGKSPIQYLILALALSSVVTIVVSEIVLFRTKWIRLKWLWAVACLLGYGQVFVDWSSGEVGFTPINITLFGAFAVKSGMLSPWHVGFALPVASILFLVLRRRLQKPPAVSGEGPLAAETF